jgi:hypothetical protein
VSAHRAINARMKDLANEISPTTWKAPFRYTLEKRPTLRIQCGGELSDDGCDACWQRGKDGYCCTTLGVYTLSTSEGIYDSDTSFEVSLRVVDVVAILKIVAFARGGS